jgi:hypothetical protein
MPLYLAEVRTLMMVCAITIAEAEKLRPHSSSLIAFTLVMSETRALAAVLPKKKSKKRKRAPSMPTSTEAAAAIEIEIGGAVIRVRQGADGRTVVAVLEALKIAR